MLSARPGGPPSGQVLGPVLAQSGAGSRRGQGQGCRAMARLGPQGRPASRSSSSRRGENSRRASTSSTTSEEEKHIVLAAPPSPRCNKRRDFKAQGRARSRAKNLRRMEEGQTSDNSLGVELQGGGQGVAGIIGGEGARQEGVPDERVKKMSGEYIEVLEPPCILVEAYTVGIKDSSNHLPVGSEDNLSEQFCTDTSAPPCLVSILVSNTAVTDPHQEDMDQQDGVVMRKNEHNQRLSNMAPEKPDSLNFEQDSQESISGFWTHRSSVISIADSARWENKLILHPTIYLEGFICDGGWQPDGVCSGVPDAEEKLPDTHARRGAGAAEDRGSARQCGGRPRVPEGKLWRRSDQGHS